TLELANIGYDLVVNYARDLSAAQRTASDAKTIAKHANRSLRVEICQGDISRAQDRSQLIEFTKAEFGRLDLLFNNAGVAPEVRADILEATEESFDRLIRINVKGPYFLTQLAAKWMIQQNKSRDSLDPVRRKIVTISSLSAYTASTNRGDYCIAKA